MKDSEIRDKMYQTIENLQRENVRLIDQRSALAYKCENEIKDRKKVEKALVESELILYMYKKALIKTARDCETLRDVKVIVDRVLDLSNGGVIDDFNGASE